MSKVISLPLEIEIENYENVKFEIECGVEAISIFEDVSMSAKRSLDIKW